MGVTGVEARAKEGAQRGPLGLLRRWGPRALGLVLFALVLRSVGLGAVWAALAEADPWPLVPMFLGAVPFIVFKSWRWARLARGLGLPMVRGGEAFRLYAIGLWWGQATPGQAGDFLKAWYLRRRGAELAPALLSCVIDRLFDFAALFTLGGLAVFAYVGGGSTVVLLAAALLVVCAALALAATERWRAPLLAALARVTPRPVRERVAAVPLLQSLVALQLDGRSLWAGTFWTAVAWVVSIGRVWLCFVAVGVRLPFTDFLSVTMLQGVAGLVSISGLGTRDAVMVAALGRYGYSGGEALAASFLLLALNISNMLPGFLLWLREPLPMAEPAPDEPAAPPAPEREAALSMAGER